MNITLVFWVIQKRSRAGNIYSWSATQERWISPGRSGWTRWPAPDPTYELPTHGEWVELVEDTYD